jgi:hypothetical protein
METGHFLTVYSAVTVPEQHAASSSALSLPLGGNRRRSGSNSKKASKRGSLLGSSGGFGGSSMGGGGGGKGATRGANLSVGGYDGHERRGRQDPRLKMAALKDGDQGFVSTHRQKGPKEVGCWLVSHVCCSVCIPLFVRLFGRCFFVRLTGCCCCQVKSPTKHKRGTAAFFFLH